jgi:hypothetical protein
LGIDIKRNVGILRKTNESGKGKGTRRKFTKWRMLESVVNSGDGRRLGHSVRRKRENEGKRKKSGKIK